MSNLTRLTGRGQEFLVNEEGDIMAEFIDGVLSSKALSGNTDITVSSHEDACDCDDCFDTEHPCRGECNECRGCMERLSGYKDTMFDIGSAQGRY